MHTKHLSFLYTVPLWHFSAAVKVVTQYTINVHYTLDYNGKVDVEGITCKPGMAKHIIDWEKLETEIQAAAENNSKDYRRPGDWMSKIPEAGDVTVESINNPYNPVYTMY